MRAVQSDCRICVILLVGAGRFELPTPCAQGSLRPRDEVLYFQLLRLNEMATTCLKRGEPG